MPVTVTLAWQGGSLSDENGNVPYYISGTASEATALAALQAGAASTIGNLVLDAKRCRIDEHLSDDTWAGTAAYREPEKVEEADDRSFSFSTAGGTEHITHSLSTTNKYIPAWWDAAPDYDNLIAGGEGVDIERKEFNFQVRVVHDAGDIDGAYIGVLWTLSQTVNDASVTIKGKAFAAGELRLRYVEGDVADDGSGTLTYFFSARPNETNVPIGDITVGAAKGHEYVWVDYIESPNNGRLVRTPMCAIVEKVYPTGTFSNLKGVAD